MSPISELAHRLHEGEVQLLHSMRHARRQRAHPRGHELSLGDRVADSVAAAVGSWRFIITQSIVLLAWMTLNVVAAVEHWDPYPFILLNLILSFQAAYTAPAIMMSQNRQAEIDRMNANSDYEVNVKAELEIELLHEKIDFMREQEFRDLSAAVKSLSQQLNALPKR